MECDARGEFHQSPGWSVLISGTPTLSRLEETWPSHAAVRARLCFVCVGGMGGLVQTRASVGLPRSHQQPQEPPRRPVTSPGGAL